MNTMFSWDLFRRLPVVGILRGFSRADLAGITNSCIKGGLANLEITMNTPDACEQIQDAIELADGRMNIGAGTVIGLAALDRALAAGASFIVTPVLEESVIRRCRELDVPVFPGAFSPTEIARAWELGAAMVKVFPSEIVGPAYIKSLKAPFPQIRLMPTGGVDVQTLPDYLAAGADGFGVGSPLFNREKIASGDWNWVENQCRTFERSYVGMR